MGGVTAGEFWRTVLVLVDTFLLSLAVGVFASVLSRDARQAFGINLLLLLGLVAIPPAVAGLIAYLAHSNQIVHPLFFSCPVYSYALCFDTSYRFGRPYFWISVGVIHALTWVLAALASWIVPRSWQDRDSGKGEARWADKWRLWVYGNAAQRLALRRRLLAVNPFCWLSSRARFKPAGVWMFVGFVACWWVYLRVAMHLNWSEESLSLTTALFWNSVLKLWIGIEACQRLAEEQKAGSLELLLSTPLNEREILRGQFLALKRQFLKPLAVVIGVEIVYMVAVSRHSVSSVEEGGRQAAFGLTGLILLILDITALSWVALLAALTAKSPSRASASAIVRVLILPWIGFAAVAVIAGIWTAGGPGPGWQFYLYLWFWLGVLTDLGYGLPAWWQLRTHFRELALQRFARSGDKTD
jgi:ABC-type transport system involved in multi-copper enzyme maturation permease subunit